jgi:hypothetical protein
MRKMGSKKKRQVYYPNVMFSKSVAPANLHVAAQHVIFDYSRGGFHPALSLKRGEN